MLGLLANRGCKAVTRRARWHISPGRCGKRRSRAPMLLRRWVCCTWPAPRPYSLSENLVQLCRMRWKLCCWRRSTPRPGAATPLRTRTRRILFGMWRYGCVVMMTTMKMPWQQRMRRCVSLRSCAIRQLPRKTVRRHQFQQSPRRS